MALTSYGVAMLPVRLTFVTDKVWGTDVPPSDHGPIQAV
jgi:hypothetical protein